MKNKINSFVIPFIIVFSVISGAVVYYFTNGNDNVPSEKDSEIIENDIGKQISKQETGVLNENEVEKEIVKNGVSNENDKELKGEPQNVGVNTEPNYDGIYNEKYGEQPVLQAKKNAALATGLWIMESADIEEWKEVATPAYANKFISQLFFVDDAVERNITMLDVVANEPINESGMDFSVFAMWEVKANGGIINEQKKVLTVHLKQENGIWMVDNITD